MSRSFVNIIKKYPILAKLVVSDKYWATQVSKSYPHSIYSLPVPYFPPIRDAIHEYAIIENVEKKRFEKRLRSLYYEENIYSYQCVEEFDTGVVYSILSPSKKDSTLRIILKTKNIVRPNFMTTYSYSGKSQYIFLAYNNAAINNLKAKISEITDYLSLSIISNNVSSEKVYNQEQCFLTNHSKFSVSTKNKEKL